MMLSSVWEKLLAGVLRAADPAGILVQRRRGSERQEVPGEQRRERGTGRAWETWRSQPEGPQQPSH